MENGKSHFKSYSCNAEILNKATNAKTVNTIENICTIFYNYLIKTAGDRGDRGYLAQVMVESP